MNLFELEAGMARVLQEQPVSPAGAPLNRLGQRLER
jgi:hypothetical protein